MLCKQCKKFFSVTDTQAGSEVVCPHCQTAQTAEQTPITCRCSNCNQKLKVEMWMEGEQVQCPSCQQEITLKQATEAPAPAAPAAPVAETPAPAPAVPVAEAPAPAPAPAAPPIPRFRTAPSAKNEPAKSKPAPAPAAPAAPKLTLNPQPAASAPAAAAPSFAQAPATPSAAVPQPPKLTLNPQAAAALAPAHPQPTPSTAAPTLTIPQAAPAPAADIFAGIKTDTAAVDEKLISAGKSLADQLCGPQTDPQDETPMQMPPQERFVFLKVHKKRIIFAVAGVAILLILLQVIAAAFRSCGPDPKQISHIASYVREERKEEIGDLLNKTEAAKRKPLIRAALAESLKSQNAEILGLLFEKGYITPNERYGEYSLLDLAAHNDYDWLLKLLIKHKANLNMPLNDGTTLLQKALRANDLKRMKELLANGADPNVGDQLGTPLIFEAVNNPDALKLLVENNANLNCRDWMRNTPLHAALLAKNEESASYLLSHKVSAAALNSRHDTALILFLRLNKGETEFLESLLAVPCNPNAVNLDQESALSLALQQERFNLIIPLLKAGVVPTDDLLGQLPEKNKFTASIKQTLEELKKEPVKELAGEKSSGKEIVPPYGGQKILLSWPCLVFWFIWIACGLLSLRMLPREETARIKAANLISFFAGPLMPIGILLQKLYTFARPWISRMLSTSDQVKTDPLRFFNADGEESAQAPSPENALFLNLCRGILTQALTRHCSGILFSPTGTNYQIILKQAKQDRQLMQLDMATGRNILIILKNLAGLDAYEEVNPQNGCFTIQKEHSRTRVLISTIGMGVQGERALLTLKRAQDELHSFQQLVLPPEGKKAVNSILAKPNGLIIVTGKPGNGRRTFISLLLEQFAAKLGSTVWIGDGNEPAGSNAVPRLKANLSAKITPEQLLGALPDCRAAAITLERNDAATIRCAFRLSEVKPIVLLLEQPTAEKAVKLCLDAGITETQMLESLKLIVSPLMLHKLCSCAVHAELPEENREDFRRLNLPDNNLRAKNGCMECSQSGEDRPVVIYGMVLPTADWLKCCTNGGMNLLRITAYCLAAKGIVALDEINNALPNMEDEENA